MIQTLQWLLVLEIVALAFLPAALWLMRWLPDRGYIFAKALGLVLLTFAVWLVGSALPVARAPWLAVAAVVVGGSVSWWLGGNQALTFVRQATRLLALEEATFLAPFFVWNVLRAYVFDPSIVHTEQFMDMAILNASAHAASYPVFDPWMSGHSINYYYLGYLMYALVTKLSSVPPAIGYNLALSTLFALTVAGAYSIGYALTRRLQWAALAPVFLALVGNWHAVFWQIPHSSCSANSSGTFWGWFWTSTRVVGGHFTLLDWPCSHASLPTTDYTINEFPLFSFILGDLHPHVLALPLTLLVIALATSTLFSPQPFALDRSLESWGRLLLVAVCVGILFTVNSWDFPTYLLVMGACILVNAYLADERLSWWHRPLLTIAALGIASVGLFLPFYLQFRSLAHGVGLVAARTDWYEFIQVFGLFLLGAGLLVLSLELLLQPAEEAQEAPEVQIPQHTAPQLHMALVPASPNMWNRYALPVVGLIGLAVLGVAAHKWVLFGVLALGVLALLMLLRVVNTEEPNRSDAAALVLIAGACLVLALTEVIYLRDAFDGGSSYRMNTVFKFYYQAWTLLALGGAYGAYRSWHILRTHFSRAYGLAALAAVLLGSLAAAYYTVQVPSTSVESYGVQSLDGMAWIRSAHPGDYAAILWLRSHVSASPVVLEGSGGGYSYAARISTFAGLPTVMGWADHEGQWRGPDPEIEQRVADVRTIYTTQDPQTAERLLRQYGVRYVVLGDEERQLYSGSAGFHATFGRFMRPAYRSGSTTIYAW